MRHICQIILLCLTIALPGNGLRAAPPASFQVTGAVLKPGVWDAARLRRDLAGDIAAVTYTLKGKSHTAHAVPLVRPAASRAAAFEPAISRTTGFSLLCSCAGGTATPPRSVWPNCRRTWAGATVWLALDEDGKPLAEDDGPVQLLVPRDAKPARWVHGVAAIVARDEASAPDGR